MYNFTNLCHVKEIREGYISLEDAEAAIRENKGLSFIDNGERSLLLGQSEYGSALIKVISNVGISDRSNCQIALARIEKLNNLSFAPDMIFWLMSVKKHMINCTMAV